MLMRDMTEDERVSTRSLHGWWTPDGWEIVELVPLYWSGWDSDTHAALVRNIEDRSTRLIRLQGTAGGDTVTMLREQVGTLRTALADTEAFLGMLDAQDGDIERLMTEIYADFEELGSLNDPTRDEKDKPDSLQGVKEDLVQWFSEEGIPTDGIEVLDSVGMLSGFDTPEYALVLYRDAEGRHHVHALRQYRDRWTSEEALAELAERIGMYERVTERSRRFLDHARSALERPDKP
ncbi:hypothetical protein [Tianweitania sediminis]|uniref:Uncharacterized protein n=1 Tax=Tianweitania sediminis TaxID=1502156 RepID=A0A8J7RIP4_9HYPH|nr:hypothetical protein [Tianweitania sediminis]MBP0439136.1 hypothetical protein [Tianweitania sediminis]